MFHRREAAIHLLSDTKPADVCQKITNTRTETRVKPGPPPAAFLLNRRKVIKTIMSVINEAMTTSLPAARQTSPLIPAAATVVGDWLLEIVFTGPGTELWDLHQTLRDTA